MAEPPQTMPDCGMDPARTLTDALLDQTCVVERMEFSWLLAFPGRCAINIETRWRLLTPEGIVFGDEDDGHRFGLPAPVDGEAKANAVLGGHRVTGVLLDPLTADLQIAFDGGVRLEIFNNSSGFEGWSASLPLADMEIIALGGGGVSMARGDGTN